MLNSLRGEITHRDGERVLLASGDLEWEIWTTARSLAALPPAGSQARLFTHLYHREDALRLYGFATAGERDLFLELMRVEGVGPRVAIRILSGVDAARFIEAVDRGDLATLVAIPGVGEKMAQKILLRLKGKLAPADSGELHNDIVAALTGMGFDRKEARDAVAQALRGAGAATAAGEDLEREILTRAMKLLGKKKER
jgi:Holliday junction DNA helicase RuvA